MLFSWKKNRSKEKIFFNKNNNDLVIELKERGIASKNILNAIKKVPRELFVSETSAQWAYEYRATSRVWTNYKPTLCGSLHDRLFKIKKNG